MRSIDIDFLQRARRQRLQLGMAAVLVIAVALLSLMVYEQRASLDGMSRQSSVGAELLPDQKTPRTHPGLIIPEATRTALQTRWDVPINAITRVTPDSLHLDNIEPDAASRLITLEGTAPDFPALQDYLRSLAKTGLQNPALLAESRDDQSTRLRFRIQAVWPAAGGAP